MNETNKDAVATWYDALYTEKQADAFGRPPYESVLRLQKVPLKSGQRVLDIGSGQGYFLKAVEEAGGKAVGIDISKEAVKISQQICPDAPVFVASGEDLPFSNAIFDVVTCWGTIEHHPNLEKAVSEVARTVKPGGLVMMRVPNRDFWLYRAAEIVGLKVGTNQSDIVEHLLSLEEWLALFVRVGLKTVKVDVDDWFLKQKLNSTPRNAQLIKLLLRKFSIGVAPLKYTYTFDILCKR